MTQLVDSFFTAVITQPGTALSLFLERGVRPKTRRNDKDRLRPFLMQFESLAAIQPADVDAWLETLNGRLSYASRQSHKQTIKTFFNWCVKDGRIQLSHSPADHVKVGRKRSARNKAANEKDLLKLMNYLENQLPDPAAARDLLAFRLFYEGGNRLTEVATLTTRAMNDAVKNGRLNQGGVVIHTAYSDDGKKGSVPVRFTEWTAAVYRLWMSVRNGRSNRVFVSVRKRDAGRPLAPDGLSAMLVRRSGELGISPIRSHAIRHLKGTKTADKYGPAVAAAMLNISFEVAQLHYYDATGRALLEATAD